MKTLFAAVFAFAATAFSNDFYERIAAYKTAENDVLIELSQNITLEELVNIPTPETVGITLTIRGGNFAIARGISGNLFTVSAGATLVLEDIIIDGNGGGGGSLAIVGDGGMLEMCDGAVLRNNNADNGGGVYVANGKFTMSGGKISGNAATFGGGVYVIGSSGVFNMNGGEINGNAASYGSGVYISNSHGESEFNLNSGIVVGAGINITSVVQGLYYLNNGVVIAIAELDSQDPSDYIEGKNTFLTALPVTATAVWAIENGKSGILYRDNEFIEILGVDVKPIIAASYTLLTGKETKLTDGWYFAQGNISYSSRLAISGDEVHIILGDGSHLNANNGGIEVGKGNSLSIYSQSTGANMGRLTATGGSSQAGIGGSQNGAVGTINIAGGAIEARGGWQGGAGIGTGLSGLDCTINISGGSINVSGGGSAADIGNGFGGFGCTINKLNGNAIVFASSNQTYLPTGENLGPAIVFIDNEGTMHGNVTIAQNITLNRNLFITDGETLTIQSGYVLTNNGMIILENGGNVIGTVAGNQPTEPVLVVSGDSDYTYAKGVLTITGNGTYAIGMIDGIASTKADRIAIASGVNANITLSGVNIDMSNNGLSAFDMNYATVNLTLEGENVLRSGTDRAGLEASNGSTLVITKESTGSLAASGGSNGAGIGSARGLDCGTISISGGTVIAASGYYGTGTGIGGGGFGGSGGVINITGGTVTASGGVYYNGSDLGGSGIGGSGGIINITGGTVNARGSGSANDIGVGGEANEVAKLKTSITIAGGSVFVANNLITGNWSDGIKRYPVKVTVVDSENGKVNGAKVMRSNYTIRPAITGGNYADGNFNMLDRGVAWLWLPENSQFIEASNNGEYGSNLVTVALSGNNSVTIAMRTYDAVQDNSDIAMAQARIETMGFGPVSQSTLNTLGAAREFVEKAIAELDLNGVGAAVNDVDFAAAVAITESDPLGTDGGYRFTVSLNKGGGTELVTSVITLAITASHCDAAFNYYALIASYATAKEDMNIKLCRDITLNSLVNIPANANGAKLAISSVNHAEPVTLMRGTSGYLFTVQAGATLILENIIIDGNNNGNFVAGSNSSLLMVNNGGAFIMNSGAIVRNNNATNGNGGVYVSSGGTFAMTGGEISGNAASYGVAVYVGSGGTFTMTGGEISRNTAGYGSSSAIYASSGGILNLNGGIVVGTGTRHSVITNTYNLNAGEPPAPNNAIIVAWTKPTSTNPIIYAIGSSTHLTILPTGTATAVWAIKDDKFGISYENGENTGFIEIPEVSVDPTFAIPKPAIAKSAISAKAVGSAIILENLPQNAKVELYSLSGKLISSKSFNSANKGSDNMKIEVQAKGMYIVKIGNRVLLIPVQ
ncbi:MAG: T9SS type A sorting domain-containing protein [Fibromonadales bacterium]|nr:T9SS type A sorting domain-containing protein [Fibromonadales bacterium]